MSYVIAQLALITVPVAALTLGGRRRQKDRCDMAEADAFIAALRATS